MTEYCKCYICNKIFDKKTGLIIKDKDKYKDKKIKYDYCKECMDYKKWEYEQYDF